MIVRGGIRVTELVRRSWRRILFEIGYSAAVVFFYQRGEDWIDVPVATPAMLGTALSILLAFRTNSAYDRWWEARKAWGGIVNSSRTFARQVLTLFIPRQDSDEQAMAAMQREMVYRQIAWCRCLARSLRGLDPLADAGATLSAEEIQSARGQMNVPNAILQTQGSRLRDSLKAHYLDTLRMLRIDETLTRLCDEMGICERIKSTIFPAYYGYLVTRIIWLFVLLLPPGLVHTLGWVTVPVSVMIAAIFWMIEIMGAQLQEPFEDRNTDTSMFAISRTIEINLREQLGETELPPKIEPIDGVLM